MPSESTLPAGFHHPATDLYTGGQPAPEDWARFARAGVRSVINLRLDAETPDRDEAAEVAAAGLEYRQVPVDGAADITRDNAAKLRHALAGLPAPVLVHCASGNRVGALLAIAAADIDGMAPDEAIQLGRAAGLAGAEARVREVLDAQPAP